MIDGNHLLFAREGTCRRARRAFSRRRRAYDHCNFTVLDDAPGDIQCAFRELLLVMSYDDPRGTPLLDLEGLKAWLPGRTSGYALLEARCRSAPAYSTRSAQQYREQCDRLRGSRVRRVAAQLLVKRALAALRTAERSQWRALRADLACASASVVPRGRATSFGVKFCPGLRGHPKRSRRLAALARRGARGSCRSTRTSRGGRQPADALGARGARRARRGRGARVRSSARRQAGGVGDDAARLYAQAAAAQWDPATAIPWEATSICRSKSRTRSCRS